jgi:hypothetical protein
VDARLPRPCQQQDHVRCVAKPRLLQPKRSVTELPTPFALPGGFTSPRAGMVQECSNHGVGRERAGHGAGAARNPPPRRLPREPLVQAQVPTGEHRHRRQLPQPPSLGHQHHDRAPPPLLSSPLSSTSLSASVIESTFSCEFLTELSWIRANPNTLRTCLSTASFSLFTLLCHSFIIRFQVLELLRRLFGLESIPSQKVFVNFLVNFL